VANDVTAITITGEANHANATVEGDGTTELEVGSNEVQITVTAEDAATTTTYTVTIIRAIPDAPDDVTLRSITISIGVLTPAFAEDVTEYTIHVANDVTTITIVVEATHPGASVTGNVTGMALEVGENEVIIIVTADDGVTTATYTFTVIREATVTGSEDIFANSLNIYPNPFTGAVHITNAEGCILRVINVAGAVVHTQMLAGDVETLSLERLPSGVYFFRLEKGMKSKTIRVVKD